jgi:hypothetical protein
VIATPSPSGDHGPDGSADRSPAAEIPGPVRPGAVVAGPADVFPAVAGGPVAAGPQPRPRIRVRTEIGIFLGIVGAGGVLVGSGWALLAPIVGRAAAVGESEVAHDAVLGLFGLAAGLITGLFLLARPGPNPGVRAAVVLFAATSGSLLAWEVGRLLHAPGLAAVGMALVWPLTAAVIGLVRSVFSLLFIEG